MLLEVGALRYAYVRIGISPRGAMLVLLGSLVGSYFNIPLTEFPERQILSGQEIDFFGIHYIVPVVVDWPGTIVAVNVGGALIPGLISLYLLVRHRLWLRGVLAIAGVSAVCPLSGQTCPWSRYRLTNLRPGDRQRRSGNGAFVAAIRSASLYRRQPWRTCWSRLAESRPSAGSRCAGRFHRGSGNLRRSFSHRYSSSIAR